MTGGMNRDRMRDGNGDGREVGAMKISRQLAIIGVVSLLLIMAGLPFLGDVREAGAACSNQNGTTGGTDATGGATYTTGTSPVYTHNIGINPNGAGNVLPPTDTATAANWDDGQSVSIVYKSGSGCTQTTNTWGITADTSAAAGSGYVISKFKYGSGAWTNVPSSGTATSGTGTFTVTTSSGGNVTAGTFKFTLSSNTAQALYVLFAPKSGSFNLDYYIVDPYVFPAVQLAAGATLASGYGSSCTSTANGTINGFTCVGMPNSTAVASTANKLFTFQANNGYVVQEVDYSTDYGTTWIPYGACAYTNSCQFNYYCGAPGCTGNGITGNAKVRASFTSQFYTIAAAVNSSSYGTITADNSGGASVNGTSVNVAKNGSRTFTITPAAGYRILDVIVTDKTVTPTLTSQSIGAIAPDSVSGLKSYTFSNVTQSGNTITVNFAPVYAAATNYCMSPPYVGSTSTVKPNVMIVFDTSGSMGVNQPYTQAGSYDNTKTYSGYFDPLKMYTLDTTTDPNNPTYFVDTVTTYSNTSANCGNKLNYNTMYRIDLTRWALIGGKVVDALGNTGTVSTAGGRPATGPYYLQMWKTDGSHPYRLYIGYTPPTGILQELAGKVNFGLTLFNTTGRTGSGNAYSIGGYVKNGIGATIAALVNSIEVRDPVGSTPLAETLYEVVRYFAGLPGIYLNDATGAINDYSNTTTWPDPITGSCQKNFVLILSDGQAQESAKLPGATYCSAATTVPTPGSTRPFDLDFNAATWENFIIAQGDRGVTDTGSPCLLSYAEAVAYYAHNTDLRSSTYGRNAILGKQNLTFYSVYSFGPATIQDYYVGSKPSVDAARTLKAISKYGGYADTDGDILGPAGNTNRLSTSPNVLSEWNTLGDHTASVFGTPDTYFSASEGDSLKTNITKAMNSMLAKVSSGTAAAILSNSSGSGANLLQAVFYPSKSFDNDTTVNWIGELQNLWYFVDPKIGRSSIYEDTTGPVSGVYTFNLISDYIVKFNFDGGQTVADLWQDTTGKGATVAPLVTKGEEPPDSVKALWKAGKTLWSKADTDRLLFTSTSGTSLLSGNFTTANASTLQPYLQTAATTYDSDLTETTRMINWVRGQRISINSDATLPTLAGFRDRTASYLLSAGPPPTYTTNQWKLGDIISSTPRIQSSIPLNSYNAKETDGGYNDISYGKFVGTANYKNRGMVYTGANDGMLHAFKLGYLKILPGPFDLATLGGTSLGNEEWAYIPRGALPYLRYLAEDSYNHLFYVDGTTTLNDVAIVRPTSGCTSSDTTNYWDCPRDNTAGTNWKSVLIGGMGLGGASRNTGGTCNDTNGNCVKTPVVDPATGSGGLGYSSYFALDISNQYFSCTTDTPPVCGQARVNNNPSLLWEFSDPGLGYATSGAAVVRVGSNQNNGRWFAVFASGPTGGIDTAAHQFKGFSDQNLKIYVVDIGATLPFSSSGSTQNYWVLQPSTPITNAFGGTITIGAFDADRGKSSTTANPGVYQDDVLYVGYTTSSDSWATSTGGILRIITNQSTNPSAWTLSPVVTGIGPVTNNVARLQQFGKALWLYAGTGRYYSANDDATAQRTLYGMKEPCYDAAHDAITPNCTTAVNTSCIVDQTAGTSATLPDCSLNVPASGWKVNLDLQGPDPNDSTKTLGAERMISDPTTLTNGSVFFTTYKPTTDTCSFGGRTYLWGMNYNNGYQLSTAVLNGKVMQQQSTGAFDEINLGTALSSKANRRTTDTTTDVDQPVPGTGKPPTDPSPVITNANLKPVKKILHIMER